MWVLLTGMSGTGKSALAHELRSRGYTAYDADEDGFSEPRADGRWGWRADRVADLLVQASDGLAFFAGCSEEQVELPFGLRVLLTAPRSVARRRLGTRTGKSYGRDRAELSQVLVDLVEVEPLLRRSADLVLCTTLRPQRSPICCSNESPSSVEGGLSSQPRKRLGSAGSGKGVLKVLEADQCAALLGPDERDRAGA